MNREPGTTASLCREAPQMKFALIVPAILLSASVWAGPEVAYEPDAATVLLLHFDEAGGDVAGDASGSQLKAGLLGPPRRPVWEAKGRFGGCLRFDGVNADQDGDGRGDADALLFKDNAKLQPDPGLTVEAWINPGRVTGAQAILSRSGGARYCFFLTEASLYFSLQVTQAGKPGWERLRTPGVVRAGTWQHVAITCDGKRIGAYVDGCRVAETAMTGAALSGESNTVIGADTDSRPIDSAIRGFEGLIDEVRVSNVARTEFNVSEERAAAFRKAMLAKPPPASPSARASISQPPVLLTSDLPAAPSLELPDRPQYPDPPLPSLNARRVTATGRVLDDAGAPLAGVLVSDGEHVVRTDEQGAYRLEFDVSDLQFVFATRPRGFKAVGSFCEAIPRDGAETACQRDFVFARDPLAAREEFTFLASGDTQFGDLLTPTELKAEFEQLTRMSGAPAFFTLAGDLTMSGTQWEMDLYKEVCAESHVRVYKCFGGHDGNYARKTAGKGSVYNFQKNLGPAWYSWDYGPAHFVIYVSETYFLTEREQARQAAWLAADLAAQPSGKPIVLITHQPPSNATMAGWLEEHNIVGVLYGHWHVVTSCGFRDVPYLETGPLRGRDWGAFTRLFRVLRFADGKLASEVRVCGQAQRLDIVAPQGAVGRGRVPVQVKAYDTVRRVVGVTCEIGAGGGTVSVPLTKTGAWTWQGIWDASTASAGDVVARATATAEDGRTWSTSAGFSLRDGPAASVRLGEDWPGLFRTGHSRVAAAPLGPPLELAWVVNTGGRNQKGVSPIVHAGRVHVGVDNKEIGHAGVGVSCHDPTDGKLLWHAATDSSVCFAPTAAGGVVYAVSSCGSCYAFDAETGAEKWCSQPFGPPSGHRATQSCPVLYGGELFVMGDISQCAVLDAATGENTRDIRLPGAWMWFSFPTVSDGRLYAGLRKLAAAYDASDGKELWRTAISTGKISSGPVLHRGRLYVNSAVLTCLNAATGEKLWQQSVPTSGKGIAVAVPAGDLVLGAGAYLKAFDAETGAVRWQCQYVYDIETAKRNQRQAYAGQSAPAVAGNVVYVGSDDGRLYAFALDSGEILWRYNLGVPIKGSPVVSGNALLVCDWDGNLFCFVGK